MSAQRFLISTKSAGRSQSQPWDSHEPLIFGKNAGTDGWLLEKTDNGDLRVRSLGQRETGPTKAHSKVIPITQAKRGVELKFARDVGDALELKITEIETLRVADFRKKEGIDLAAGFVVYSTVGDWTTQMSVHRREYRAFWLKQEIFRVLVTPNGVRLVAKKAGVRFESEEKWYDVKEDSEKLLTESEFFKTTVAWGNHEWHFTGVVAMVRDSTFESRRSSADESDFQKATGVSLLLLLLFFLGGRFLAPLLPKVAEENKPLSTQIVKILKKEKKKEIVKHEKKLEIPGEEQPKQEKVAAKSEAPTQTAAPEQIVIPKGNPPPITKTAKNEPVKGRTEKPVVKAKPPEKNRITTLAAGSFLGGLQKIINNDASLKAAKAGHEGKFKGDAKSFTSALSGIQMNVAATGSGSADSKVTGFGGSDGASVRGPASIGYGAGAKTGTMSGTGGSNISLGVKDAEVDEGLTRDEVGRVIHAHMKEVRYCYEASMLRAPASKVEGQVAMAFTIVASGRVSKSNVAQSSVPDGALGECIRKRLDTWQFPHPKGGVNVNITYPFIFNTLGGG